MARRVTNIRRLAFAPALVLTVLLASASAAATAPRMTVKAAGGPVHALAMDGGRVAYDVGNSRNSSGVGNKVLVWNVLTGRTTQVSGKPTSAADVTSTGRGVREVAIAGARVRVDRQPGWEHRERRQPLRVVRHDAEGAA